MRAAEQLLTAFAGLGAVIFFATIAEVEATPSARGAPITIPTQPTVSPMAGLSSTDATAEVQLGASQPLTREPVAQAPVLGALEISWPYTTGVQSVLLNGEGRELFLDLEQSPLGAELRLNVDRQRVDEIQIAFQYETSLSLGFEGPHWDLLDFEHHTAEWTDLPRSPMGTWMVPALDPAQQRQFPQVSEAQIHQAVRSYLSEWDDADMPPAPLCSSANDGPCHVGLSRVSLRVRALKKGRLVQESTVDLQVPMGC